jgi:hypothetical protein
MAFDLLLINEKNQLEVHPSVLTIKAIADLWNRDKTNKKEQALRELAFIYWMYHWKSSYFKQYPDETERLGAVIVEVFQDVKWRPDLEVSEAGKAFTKQQLLYYPELSDLQVARGTLNKLKEFLENLDPGEVTRSGGLVLKPADIYTAISKMGEALLSVQKMEKKIKEDISLDTQQIKGGGKAGAFEDETNLDYLKE